MNKSYKYCCMVYATAPFIKSEHIRVGLERLVLGNADAAISVTSSPSPAQRAYTISDQGNLDLIWPEHFAKRSQDLPKSYFDAAQFNWTNIERCYPINKINRNNFSKKIIPIILPRSLVQDLDDTEDWNNAELMFEVFKSKKLIR